MNNLNSPFARYVTTFNTMWNEFERALPDRVEGFNFKHLISELNVLEFYENRENRNVDNIILSAILVSNVMDIVEFFHSREKYIKEVHVDNDYIRQDNEPTLNFQYYVEEGARIINYTWNSLCKRTFRILRSLYRGISYLIHSHYVVREFNEFPFPANVFLALAEYGYGEFPTRGFPLNVHVPVYPIIDKKTGTFHICAGLSGSILEIAGVLILSFSGTHTRGPYKIGDYVADAFQIFATFPNYLGAVKILEELCAKIGGNYNEIIVVGHSLGGGLSQFAFGHNTYNYNNLYGIGFNSAGLSKPNFSEVKRFVGTWRFTHVFVDNDWVHQYGNHIGVAIELEHLQGYSRYKSHSIDSLFAIIGEECHCEPI